MDKKRVKDKKFHKLKMKFVFLVFLTIFLGIIISNSIFKAIEIDLAIKPQLAILTSAFINMLIIGLVIYILFNKIIIKSLNKIYITNPIISIFIFYLKI